MTPPEYTIRQATPEDYEAIRAAHLASILELAPLVYNPEVVEAWAAPKRKKEYIKAYKEKVDSGETYFAAICTKRSDYCLGFSSYFLENPEKHKLQAIYVRGTESRKGIGSALLKEVEACAIAQGAWEIWIDGSLVADKFYLHHGYQVVEKYMHEADGTSAQCVRMKKTLGDS